MKYWKKIHISEEEDHTTNRISSENETELWGLEKEVRIKYNYRQEQKIILEIQVIKWQFLLAEVIG